MILILILLLTNSLHDCHPLYVLLFLQVFGSLALNPGEDIERHTNFRTFLAAVMLLFR